MSSTSGCEADLGRRWQLWHRQSICEKCDLFPNLAALHRYVRLKVDQIVLYAGTKFVDVCICVSHGSRYPEEASIQSSKRYLQSMCQQ
jgi:hypothetical protein